MYAYPFTPWVWRESVLTADDYTDEAGGTDEDRAATTGRDFTGYDVEATDGRIGSVDQTSHEVDASHLVVDTGPWIFGRKVLLPAGTVQRIDHDEQKVYVDRTKDQIKESPEYDPDTFGKPDYRERVGTYYEDSYRAAPPV
jgi:hypothetical protein